MKVRPLSLLLVFLAFLLIWSYFVFIRPVTLWTLNEDAPLITLAQAVNLDFWFLTPARRAVSQAQYYQPGVPLQFVSWFLYRAAYFGASLSPVELFRVVIQNPAPYWLATQISALLLAFLSIALLWRQAIRFGLLTALATVLGYYASISASHYGIYLLWNESFTLLFACFFFFSAFRFFRAPRDRRWRWLFGSAILGAGLYLHKMNYVVWAAAMLPAMLIEGVLLPMDWKKSLAHALAFVAVLIGGVILLGKVSMGVPAFNEMIRAHREIFFGSGIYGSGPTSIVNLKAMGVSARQFFHVETYLSLLLAFFLAVGMLAIVQNRREKTWLQRQLPELVLLGCATLGTVLSLFKHFQSHYTVAAAALVPFWILWLARDRRQKWIFVALPVILFGIYRGLAGHVSARQDYVRAEAQTSADEKMILEMPLATGQTRLWVYRYMSPTAQRLLILNFSGHADLQKELNAVQGAQYLLSPYNGLVWTQKGYVRGEAASWRYVVAETVVADHLLDWQVFPWLKTSNVKRIDLQRTTVFENLNPRKSEFPEL